MIVVRLLTALVLLLAGCPSAFDDQERYACSGDDDCADGFYCQLGRRECVVDTTPAGYVFYGQCTDAQCTSGMAYRLEIPRPGVAALPTAQPLSAWVDGLDGAPTGTDQWAAPSASGAWTLLGTQRGEGVCADQGCLARVSRSAYEAIEIAGQVVQGSGGAVDDTGDLVLVVALRPGSDQTALYATRRGGAGWGALEDLTAGSASPYHAVPALTGDGCRVALECRQDKEGLVGTAICELAVGEPGCATARTGVAELVDPAQTPDGCADCTVSPANLRHPTWTPDGGLVFDADWTGQVILWRRTAAGTVEPVTRDVTYQTRPCVLPDGRIVSRSGHESQGASFGLRLFESDGTGSSTLLPAPTGPGVDASRLGCSG